MIRVRYHVGMHHGWWVATYYGRMAVGTTADSALARLRETAQVDAGALFYPRGRA